MQASSSRHNGLGRDLLGLACTFLACFLLLGIVTYHPHDPSFTQVVSPGTPVHNGAGMAGAYAAGLLVDLVGVAAYVFPAVFILLALKNFIHRLRFPWWRWMGLGLLTLFIAAISSTFMAGFSIGRVAGGGFLGESLATWTGYVLGPWGARILAGIGLLLAVQLLAGDIWSPLVAPLRTSVQNFFSKHQERKKRKERLKKLLKSFEESGEEPTQEELEARLAALEADEDADDFAEEEGAYPYSMDVDVDGAVEDAPWADSAREVEEDEAPIVFNDGKAEPARSRAEPEEVYVEDEESDTGEDFDANDPIMALERLSHTAKLRLQQESAEESSAIEPPTQEDIISLESETAPEPVSKPRTPAGEGRDVVMEGQIDPEADLVRDSKKLSERKLKKLILPPKALLASVEGETKATPPEELKRQAQALHTTLQDFGVQGEVTAVRPGPVVTLFEFKPAPGIKISKIANLSDDLALTLKAMAIRIEAPIPGKDTVGVEIPSKYRQTVHYREILESGAYAKSESYLTLALGKDINGEPCVADLAKMPHLLVAGATGTGKSVCLNSLLLSILFKAKPAEVKLLLVDPKRIELAVYADLPHLIHPVVTEMSHAKNALEWAVHEMDQRYQAMAKLAVRNVQGYNEKLKKLTQEQRVALDNPEPIPYLVIVIDELADLMLIAAKEVEMSIVRLAQLARAAGIHMILATQRPSVDVVTGLIKANFPCRISFQVTSKHDSRTILDTVGSEHLLGKGDMLFKPGGGKLQRIHGAFVSDEDVAAVVNFWKAQQQPSYSMDFSSWSTEGDAEGGSEIGPGEMDNDQKYQDAVDFVTNQGKASISLLQRRFRIGFNKAARYIEQMEVDGIVGPADGSKPRPVLRGRDE
ncbi:DNA translocase FtsK [Oceanidesulfovibrio indonesiensis]|uniref:DNA translocase FtsK n=1 Tax=Oceanidesulfovibrio indonesiensis TaxID=54767 RepID=A0A7M3MBS8_9BACT|nr:DNA translocase FtsK [Oceanidesulfovibrio indonesiensis]TVM15679.1 DNA translocase FtsK [Oceanidesulfovibrio indonesiensis]